MADLKIVTKLQSPNIKAKSYINEVDKYMKEQQLVAIKRWLINVLKHTPTYTGTARGTYAPIGRVVRHNVRAGVARGDRARAKKKKHMFYRGKKFPLGFTAGARYSDHKIKREKHTNSFTYIFEFDQRLPYVIWNELNPAPPGFILPSNPPWHALRSGRTAYTRFANGKMRKNFPRLKTRKVNIDSFQRGGF